MEIKCVFVPQKDPSSFNHHGVLEFISSLCKDRTIISILFIPRTHARVFVGRHDWVVRTTSKQKNVDPFFITLISASRSSLTGPGPRHRANLLSYVMNWKVGQKRLSCCPSKIWRAFRTSWSGR